jgi:hypothetical protein
MACLWSSRSEAAIARPSLQSDQYTRKAIERAHSIGNGNSNVLRLTAACSWSETLIPSRIDPRIQFCLYSQNRLVVVLAIKLITISWLTNGRPREFWAMRENMRRSNLFTFCG